jgi:hypothetical protein
MAHKRLQGTRIDSTARQGVAGGIREWQLSGHAKPFDELLSAIDWSRDARADIADELLPERPNWIGRS